jgi:hypothetical protein
MTSLIKRFHAAIFPVGLALALSIFSATFYFYIVRRQAHTQSCNLCLADGVSAFFSLMIWLNYLTQVDGTVPQRIFKAIGVAVVETVLFLALLEFLISNTLES